MDEVKKDFKPTFLKPKIHDYILQHQKTYLARAILYHLERVNGPCKYNEQ